MADEMMDEELERPADAEALDARLAELAGRRGYHRTLDADHTATLIPAGDTLLVSFETAEQSLSRDTGLPLSLDFAEGKNWSILHVCARRATWFRSPAVYAFFDDLADDVFFDEFDRVIFYGADAGGYAAAAYSVTAPGARVILVSPQATLDTARADWDNRFTESRRIGFRGRFAYAPDMVDAAEAVTVVYDPARRTDAMHASLFSGDNVMRLRAAHFPAPDTRPLSEVIEPMGIIHALIERVGADNASRAAAHAVLRARRRDLPYLRHLVTRALARGNPRLVALLCKAVLSRASAPMFRRRLQAATAELEARGERPDWLDD